MTQNFLFWFHNDHNFNPYVVADNGDLVPSSWDAFATFFNQEYTSRTVAMQVYQ